MVAADGTLFCARHPKVETVLRCGRCDTPICTRCLVQTAVGVRCKACSRGKSPLLDDGSPAVLIFGLGGAITGGLFTGAVWGYVIKDDRTLFAFYDILAVVIIGLVIGWAVSQLVDVSVWSKRGTRIQACGVFGCALAYVIHNLVAGNMLLPPGDLFGYATAALGAFIAATRLRE